jgi:hypothetical protein
MRMIWQLKAGMNINKVGGMGYEVRGMGKIECIRLPSMEGMGVGSEKIN